MEPVSVVVTKGRSIGQCGKLVEIGYTDKGEDRIVFKTADGTLVDVSHKQVEFADANGDPIVDVVKDTLGQTVQEGQFVAYSSSGNYGESHTLEVGKIVRITDAGSLIVKPILTSGEKAVRYGYQSETKTVKTPRALRLPVDETLLAMHVLSEFQDFEKRKV